MKRILVPALTLGLLATSLTAAMKMAGRLESTIEPDSASYLEFDFSTPLTQVRTIGYPLFLRLAGDIEAIPWLHWSALGIASIVFAYGLIAAGYRQTPAIGCAAILMVGRAGFEFANSVTSDSLAISVAIAAAGCFLATTRQASNIGWWCGLPVLTFATYQIRPAFLFLIPSWPLASLMLDRWLTRRHGSGVEHLRRVAIYAMLGTIPFLGFCTLRWARVGHWGLVSFGGYNLVGVCGQFLDERLVPELSEEVQPLARKIIENRKEIQGYQLSDDFLTMERMFNPTVWKLAVPAAESMTTSGDVSTNALLNQLSREILILRWDRYLRWLALNAIHGIKQTALLLVYDRGTWILGILLMATLLRRLIWPGRSVPETSFEVRRLENHLLLWTTAIFFLGGLSLVILVEPANGRYMSASSCLIPAVLALWTFHASESVV